MKILVLPVIALGLTACAATPAQDNAMSLARAESAFAAHSVREDMRAAFLANFADEGVLPLAAWTRANDYLRERPAPPIVLEWRPVFVEVAASGEMGVSTGPSRITRKADAASAPTFGQFVSVWRRGSDGAWKVAVDIGIGHPTPALWEAPLDAHAVPPIHTDVATTAETSEARFIQDCRELGLRKAYEAHGSERLRLYRDGAPPTLTLAAALASPRVSDERWQWRVERSETS